MKKGEKKKKGVSKGKAAIFLIDLWFHLDEMEKHKKTRRRRKRA